MVEVIEQVPTQEALQESEQSRKLSTKAGVALILTGLALTSTDGHDPAAAEQNPVKPSDVTTQLGHAATAAANQEPPHVISSHSQHTSHLTAKVPSPMPPILNAIGGCESGSGPNSPGNYKAENQNSTASGKYQFLDSTWNNYMGYRRALYAPKWVQDLRAKVEYKMHGTAPWYASKHCWG